MSKKKLLTYEQASIKELKGIRHMLEVMVIFLVLVPICGGLVWLFA